MIVECFLKMQVLLNSRSGIQPLNDKEAVMVHHRLLFCEVGKKILKSILGLPKRGYKKHPGVIRVE